MSQLDDREIIDLYQRKVDYDSATAVALESYAGAYKSEADWAADFMEETGMLAEVPEHLRNYIDFAAYARDARLGGDMVFVPHPREYGWVVAFRANI